MNSTRTSTEQSISDTVTETYRRTLIIGSGGAGKSTLARELADLLGLPLLHLDRCYWQPGWIETERSAWLESLERMLAGERWVMDGNYSQTLEERLRRASAVIFLDFPRLLCLRRVLLRTYQHYGLSRPDMTEGCPERLDLEFARWIWNYPRRSRPKVLKLLAAAPARVRVIHLRSPLELERFMEELQERRSAEHIASAHYSCE